MKATSQPSREAPPVARKSDKNVRPRAGDVHRVAEVIGLRIPDFECVIISVRGDPRAIGTDGAPMPAHLPQRHALLSGLYIPDFERVIIRARGDPRAIWTYRAFIHLLCVTLKG